ncbi:MAG: leucine-rich repeat protein [Clostridia bacterium]|nr:leucine-rich repeat protein [Clostridia bacterium]
MKTKRSLGLLMALLFTLGVLILAFTATAGAEEIVATGRAGANVTFTLYDDGKLILEGSGLCYDDEYSEISSIRSKIKEVVIGENITSIGNKMFAYCGMERISIGADVETIGEQAFYNNQHLTTVTFAENSKLKEIGSRAFDSCIALKTINLPDSVTTIGKQAFKKCEAADTLTIPANLVHLGERAFQWSGIKTVSLPASLKTDEEGTVGWYAFEESDVTTVTVAEGVQSLRPYMFFNCIDLRSVSLPNSLTELDLGVFVGSGIENITLPPNLTGSLNAFRNCTNLEQIDIPAGVTYVDGFDGCTSLERVSIPDTVTEIGMDAFKNCSALQEIDIHSATKKIGTEAFSGCTALRRITLPSQVEEFGGVVFRNCSSLDNVVLPRGVKDVSCFHNCTSLTSVTIPDTVTEISGFGFYNCTSLQHVTIPGSVTQINGFDGCTALTEINIPSGVREVGGFEGCIALRNVTLSDTVELLLASAFKGCTALTNITLPDSVTRIFGSAFEDCTNLTTLNIPAGVTYLSDAVFANCPQLDGVVLPEGIERIYDRLFEGCASLTSINIPENVKAIDNRAFAGCTSLTEIRIPKAVTSIGVSAFEGCTGLATVKLTFVSGTVGANAFAGCPVRNLQTCHSEADWTEALVIDNTDNGNDALYTAEKIFGHDMVKVAKSNPTTRKNGNIEHYACTRCGRLSGDPNGVNELTQEQVTIARKLTLFEKIRAFFENLKQKLLRWFLDKLITHDD